MRQTNNAMQTLFGFDSLPHIRHAVATVGSYDGVHSGHQVLIEQVVQRAKLRGGESVVLTFEPHPRITLGQDEGLKLLTTIEEKRHLLERMGVDYMLIIPFDREFSRLSHEQFISDYLIGKLHIEELVVGYNHHFGHNKGGDYNYLATQGLEVTRVAQQLVESNKVSSTVIRATIERGDMRVANQLLGHTYIIIGASDNNGFIATDSYKLLPPTGSYRAIVNGVEGEIRVVESGICCSINNKLITIGL